MKLYLDPGHGGSDPGAAGNGMKEKEVVLDIAQRIRRILTGEYKNISIKMSRTGDRTKTLRQRTNEANSWGADYYLSIHCNAFNRAAHGYEDFIHDSLTSSSRTAHYQDIMHAEISKVADLANRGQKKANFHVLRETVMPALLTENGFIDNRNDAAFMKDNAWREKVAQGHVNGLARAFNLRRKQGNTETTYKVIAGSFKTKENANTRITLLRNKGIESFMIADTISGSRWYRVQAGAFTFRKNAENQLSKVKKAGIQDAFIA
ncbi:N-acetylmuramoyl-L-alanine amidase [Virgibacillus ainsalahensis]